MHQKKESIHIPDMVVNLILTLTNVCKPMLYLTKHLVVLNILDFVGADLALQSVLVELAAYVDQ